MALDLTALKAKLAAKKLETPVGNVTTDIQKEIKNEQTNVGNLSDIPAVLPVVGSISSDVSGPAVEVVTQAATPVISTGATRVLDINTMDFVSKVQELEEALLGQHPKMPVLLMLIHKQIAADPELVTILSEESIGIIVSALKVQTKTELVGTILKQSKAKDKKVKLSADMF